EAQLIPLGAESLGEHVVLADPAGVVVVIIVLVRCDVRADAHLGVVPRPVVVVGLAGAAPVRAAAAGVEDIEQAIGRCGPDGVRNGLLLAGLLARNVAVPVHVALGRDDPRILLPILLGPAQDVQPVLAAVLDDGDRAARAEP